MKKPSAPVKTHEHYFDEEAKKVQQG